MTTPETARCQCGRPGKHFNKTICHACYERNRKVNPPHRPSAEDRFFSKVRQEADPAACWIWLGAKGGGGQYGVFNLGSGGRRKALAHRWSFEFLRAEIPDGLVIDHLCRNPPCVNPWHMDPVTIGVNSLRGEAPTVVAARNGVCPRGHSLADAAVVLSGPQKGRRNCRTCISLRHAARASDPEWRARRNLYEYNRKRRAFEGVTS